MKFLLIVFVFFVSLGTVSADETAIRLTSAPLFSALRPFRAPATLTLAFLTRDGKQWESGSATIRLDAPKHGGMFSTDIPAVEGTRLFELHLPITDGKVEWQYLFPIRGEYRMTVEASSAAGRQATETFRIKIRENEKKWVFLGAFTSGLFFFAFTAGRVFTHSNAGKLRRAGGLCLFLTACLTSWYSPATGDPTMVELPRGQLSIEPAAVGKLSRVRWQVTSDQSLASPATFYLRITHLEENKTVFALSNLPLDGDFAMKFQFTDGDEYHVAATANIQGSKIIRAEKNVTVAGVEPSAVAAIPPIAMFIAVMALGLAVGRWSKKTATRPSRAGIG